MYSTFTKDNIKKFVAAYGDQIIIAITNKNLFFPTVVGQLTMESTWASSDLSMKYNNYGGIKNTGSQYSNGKVSLDTVEVQRGKEIDVSDYFATYADFKNFMADYVRVLSLPQYVSAGVYTAQDPYQQILAIGKGGYSTRDPQKYLSLSKDRINACMDLFPWGKISTSATAPDGSPGSSLQVGLNSIQETLIKAAGINLKPFGQ